MHGSNTDPNLRHYRVHLKVIFTVGLSQFWVLSIKLRENNFKKLTQGQFDARVRLGMKIRWIGPEHRMRMNWGLRRVKRTSDRTRDRVMDFGVDTPKSTILVAMRNVMPIRVVGLATQRSCCIR
jgi:hypothetical protein